MSVNQVAITSDSESVLYNCRIWDSITGRVISKFRSGHCGPRSLAVIGHNYLIGGLSDRKALNVWPVRQNQGGKVQENIDCIGLVCALAVSPQGSFCVGAIATKLYLWEIATGELLCVLTNHYGNVNCVKFTDDGCYFVSGGEDSFAFAWDLNQILIAAEDGIESFTQLHTWKNHVQAVTDIHVGWSFRQTKVATVSKDKSCRLYALLSGECLYTIIYNEPLYSVVMDPTETHIFLGTDSGVIVKALLPKFFYGSSIAITENSSTLLRGHSDVVTCLSVSPDGMYLLSGSKDTTALVWSIGNSKISCTVKHDGPITNAFFPRSLHLDDDMPSKLRVKRFNFILSSSDSEEYECIPRSFTMEKYVENDNLEEFHLTQKKNKEAVSQLKESDSKINKNAFDAAVYSIIDKL